MAIAKKPKVNRSENINSQDVKAEEFISGQGTVTLEKLRQNKQPIMVRFDITLLGKVDAAARHRGVSRSSWIQYVISRALDSGEG